MPMARRRRIAHERKFKIIQNQITGWLMQHQQPLLSKNLKRDVRFSGVAFGDFPAKSVLGAPLRIDGE